MKIGEMKKGEIKMRGLLSIVILSLTMMVSLNFLVDISKAENTQTLMLRGIVREQGHGIWRPQTSIANIRRSISSQNHELVIGVFQGWSNKKNLYYLSYESLNGGYLHSQNKEDPPLAYILKENGKEVSQTQNISLQKGDKRVLSLVLEKDQQNKYSNSNTIRHYTDTVIITLTPNN